MTIPTASLNRVQIHLTNRCNLECRFCDVPRRLADSREMPDSRWIDIVKELAELGAREITISGGGEPTTRFDLLIETMRLSKLNGLKLGIITNGTLMNDDYARRVVEVGPDEWRTSICSPDRETDAFLRGKDLSDASFRGVEQISKWKKRMSSDLPKTEVWMVQTKYNIEGVGKMIEKAHAVGANSLSLRMVNPPQNPLYPEERQLRSLVERIQDYKDLAHEKNLELKVLFQESDIFPRSSESNRLEKNQKDDADKDQGQSRDRGAMCLLPFKELAIFADGRVSPCCNFVTDDVSSPAVESLIGKSVREVWLGEKLSAMRSRMVSWNALERCSKCTPDFKLVNKEYEECA
jgi:MoaA/NifB/PqqE/SkfB family radical SAM enzyme